MDKFPVEIVIKMSILSNFHRKIYWNIIKIVKIELLLTSDNEQCNNLSVLKNSQNMCVKNENWEPLLKKVKSCWLITRIIEVRAILWLLWISAQGRLHMQMFTRTMKLATFHRSHQQKKWNFIDRGLKIIEIRVKIQIEVTSAWWRLPSNFRS